MATLRLKVLLKHLNSRSLIAVLALIVTKIVLMSYICVYILNLRCLIVVLIMCVVCL